MASDNGNNIKDDSGTPGILGYDPTSQQLVLLEAVSVTTDTVNGKNVKYGVLQSNASFSASSLAINDPTTTTQKASVDASGNLHTLDANSASSNTHLGNIDTATADLVADLDTIITNTGRIPTSPAQEGGNLATIVTRLTSILADLGAFADSSVTGTVTNDLDTVAITCPGGQATALVSITGTFVGTLLFEGTPDGGTTWDMMNAVALGAPTVATQTTTTGAWRINVSGLTSFHVKLHPTTSGTASIRINLSQGVHNVAVTNATQLGQNTMLNSSPVALPSDQSAIPVNQGSGAAAGTAWRVKSDFTEVAGQGTGVVNAINTDLIPSMDISGYKHFSIQLAGTWSATFTVQVCNDNANWQALTEQQSVAGVSNFSTITANGLYDAPLKWRFFRVRATAFTSNTSLVGTAEFYTMAAPVIALTAVQGGTWTVQPGNTPNTTPWLVTGSNNNGVQAANTAANTVIKGTPGLLQGAMITATGTAGLTVYDNASTNSGTPVLVIPANPTVGQLYPVNGWCKNGIVSAGVANCPGVTFFFA